MKITVIGAGYVGLSNAILLAQHNEVVVADLLQEKADCINRKQSPIEDREIQEYLQMRALHLTATTDGKEAVADAELVIIATPTNYDPDDNYFDTSSVEAAVEATLAVNQKAVIVIKSTVPVGYTECSGKHIAWDAFCFFRNFCGRAMRCGIIFIRPALLRAFRKSVRSRTMRRGVLWNC